MAKRYTIGFLRAQKAIGLPVRKKARKRLPRQIYPSLIEVEFTKAMIARIDLVRKVFEPLLRQLPGYIDAGQRYDASDLPALLRLLDRAEAEVMSIMSEEKTSALAARFGDRTSAWNAAQLAKQAQAATGVALPIVDRQGTRADNLGVSPFGDKGVQAVLLRFAKEQGERISRHLGTEVVAGIRKAITKGIEKGLRHEQIAERIQKQFDIAEDQARFIAQDQVGRLYGQINHQRQKDLGIEYGFWRNMGDEKVRPEHVARGGERFALSEGINGELPGQPTLCRCYTDPDFQALLDSL